MQQLHELYGLDKPVFVQRFSYITLLKQLNIGYPCRCFLLYNDHLLTRVWRLRGAKAMGRKVARSPLA